MKNVIIFAMGKFTGGQHLFVNLNLTCALMYAYIYIAFKCMTYL